MAGLGVDYSFARPGGPAIKAAGFDFVCRYLASSPSKALTRPELDDLQSNGLSVVLVFEDEANQALLGEVQGVKDAQQALAQAEAIGWPNDRPIYFAVDFDATEQQQNAINSYLQAAGSVLGNARVGVYGGFYVVKRALDAGVAKWCWQTVAWSGGQVDPRTHIYQNGQNAFNGGCDIDESRQPDFGQWPNGGNMSTIATEDLVNSLAEAYLEDNISKNPSLSMYVGHPVEEVINAFNGAAERNNYLVSINQARAAQAQVPDLLKQVGEPQKKLGNEPAISKPFTPKKTLSDKLKDLWKAIFG